MKLYELTKELAQLADQLESLPEDEETKTEIYNRLDQFGVQFEFKAEQIGKLIINLQSDIEQLKAEEERLYQRRKSLTTHMEHLKEYLLYNMEQLQINHVKGDVLNVVLRDNPPSVLVINLELIPQEFNRVIHKVEPDKKAIIEHFKSTGEIPAGCEIVRQKRVEIK